MSLESDLFAGMIPDRERLEHYGFAAADGNLVYTDSLMDGAFRAEVCVDADNRISGGVFDSETGDEYVLVHTRVRNSYAAKVRSAYLDLLEDIARKCFVPGAFLSAQANRLAEKIHALYGDRPDKPWKKDNGYTVFRNHDTGKWYAVTGLVPGNRLDPELPEDTVEIMNLKVREERLAQELTLPDIFPAYHMNKKNWISVLLDGRVTDEHILELIAESRSFTVVSNPDLAPHDWLVPANPKYYDVIGAFRRDPVHVWPMRRRMQEGDTVYIYYAAPYSCLIMRCRVTGVYPEGNELTLEEFYDRDRWPLSELKAHGANTVRFVTRIPLSLKEYLEG